MNDGVPCEPGSMIRQDDGTWWVCAESGKQYEFLTLPACTEGQYLKYGKSGMFYCEDIQKEARVDPLWIILIVAVVFTLGALTMGLTQWWRNRKKAKEEEIKPVVNWEDLLVGPGARTSAEDAKKGFGNEANEIAKKLAGELDKFALNNFQKEVQVADPTDKIPDSLQDEIKEIYMQIQLGRGEINKIPGFVQICVNSAMVHLNKARDMVAALGDKVK